MAAALIALGSSDSCPLCPGVPVLDSPHLRPRVALAQVNLMSDFARRG